MASNGQYKYLDYKGLQTFAKLISDKFTDTNSKFLPLTGGALTGPLVFNGSDTDRNVIRVNCTNGDATKIGEWGYTLKFLGSGSGINNALALYADNSEATTQNLATKWLNDGTMYGRSILPHTTNTFDLGSSSLKWNKVYATSFEGTNASLTGDIVIKNSGSSNADTPKLYFQRGTTSDTYYDNFLYNTGGALRIGFVKSSTDIADIYQFGTDAIKPLTNNVYTLGTSDYKWSNIYATTFTGNVTGSADSILSNGYITTSDELNNLSVLNQLRYNLYNNDSDTGLGLSSNDGFILTAGWNSAIYASQLALDDNGYNIAFRYKNGSWSNWKKLAFVDGTGATGTWPISITGNAAGALSLSGGTMSGTINSRSIIPTTTNAYDLGSSSYRFKGIHSSLLNVYDGYNVMGNASGSIDVYPIINGLYGAQYNSGYFCRVFINDLEYDIHDDFISDMTNGKNTYAYNIPALSFIKNLNYDSSINYEQDRFVKYVDPTDSKTKIYRCIKATTGNILPTNTTYWECVSANHSSSLPYINDPNKFIVRIYINTNNNIFDYEKTLTLFYRTQGQIPGNTINIYKIYNNDCSQLSETYKTITPNGYSIANSVYLSGITPNTATGIMIEIIPRCTSYWETISQISLSGVNNFNPLLFRTGGYIDGNIYPRTNNTHQIGTSSNQFNLIYGKTLYENGTSLANKYLGKTAQAASSAKTGDGTNILYAEKNNEINFGGTVASDAIYFGYRATDSKAIPSKFVFGGNTGTAELLAKTYKKSDGTEVSYNGHIHTYLTNGGLQPSATTRNLTDFPTSQTLFTGRWTSAGGYATNYGTTLDISYSAWYQRLAFNTTGRIEYFRGISTNNSDNTSATLTKVGDLAYISDIPTESTVSGWGFTKNTGNVTGPASSVNNRVAVFDGTTGKVIKDSGYTISTSVPSTAIFTDQNVLQNYTTTAMISSTNNDVYPLLFSTSTVSQPYTGAVVRHLDGIGWKPRTKALMGISSIPDVSSIGSGNDLAINGDLLTLQGDTGVTISGANGGVTISSESFIDISADSSVTISGETNINGKTTITGNCYATAFYETSDENLKDFSGDVDIDFAKLKEIRKSYFTWKDGETGKTQIGTSAQDVQKVYPELVSEDNNGNLTVDYAKLSIIALYAIDKLDERLSKIEKVLNITE